LKRTRYYSEAVEADEKFIAVMTQLSASDGGAASTLQWAAQSVDVRKLHMPGKGAGWKQPSET